jgi:hypothetical protein
LFLRRNWWRENAVSAECCHGGKKAVLLKKFQVISCRQLLVDVVKRSARIVGSMFILWENNNEHVLQFPSAISYKRRKEST